MAVAGKSRRHCSAALSLTLLIPSVRARLQLFGRLGLHLDVVFAPDLANQLQLRLEEIDVLFLALQDFAEQVAGDEVANTLAIGDRLPQLRHRQLFEPKI